MFVRQMLGPEDGRHEITFNPTWQQIEAAILRLDNRTCSDLGLTSGPQNPSLSIGGGKSIWKEAAGWDALCFVFATDNEGNSYILYYPAISVHYPSPERIELRCGGQESERDAQACVNQAMALQAAKTFSESGERDQSLCWYKDEPWSR